MPIHLSLTNHLFKVPIVTAVNSVFLKFRSKNSKLLEHKYPKLHTHTQEKQKPHILVPTKLRSQLITETANNTSNTVFLLNYANNFF
jgi:hypothetical protein